MASEAYAGWVTYVNEKDWNGRNGPIKLYSYKIEGNDTYFRTGRKDPKLKRDQHVQFLADGQDVDYDSIVRGEVRQSSPKSSGGGSSRDNYWAEKDKHDKEVVQPRIQYCAARRDAITLAEVALANGALSLGTKKADALRNLVNAVGELTNDLIALQDQALGESPSVSAEKVADEIPDDAWEDE